MEDLAAADGFIGCYTDKYYWQFWRPITAIREADTDGNPATEADPNWTPLFDPATPQFGPPLATPPFPDHLSAHSPLRAQALLPGGGLTGPLPGPGPVHEQSGVGRRDPCNLTTATACATARHLGSSGAPHPGRKRDASPAPRNAVWRSRAERPIHARSTRVGATGRVTLALLEVLGLDEFSVVEPCCDNGFRAGQHETWRYRPCCRGGRSRLRSRLEEAAALSR